MLIKERIRHDNVEIQSIIPIMIVGPLHNDHHNISLFPIARTETSRSMGAAWQRPTVGDIVLVSGHGELSRLRRWGQLFADDGEQEPALDGYGYRYIYIYLYLYCYIYIWIHMDIDVYIYICIVIYINMDMHMDIYVYPLVSSNMAVWTMGHRNK